MQTPQPISGDWFEVARAWLELSSFASGPILVVLAAIALRSITIARKTANAASRREAATVTAQLCDKYAERILPAASRLRDKLRPHVRFPLKINLESFTSAEINAQDPGVLQAFDRAIKIDKTIGTDMMNIANMLEGIAIYFTKGVADESIAFPPLGQSFIDEMMMVLPQIAANRDDNPKFYTNCIDLYDLWNDRFQREELTKKLAGVTDRKLPTLGTDI